MNDRDLYPLAEKARDRLRAPTGKSLDDISVEAVLNGKVSAADVAVSRDTLELQARIARAHGRETLARNFERAAELVDVPQALLLETYEMLRPGRADSATLQARADHLRRDFAAQNIAAFIEEAAAVYEKRGIFRKRF